MLHDIRSSNGELGYWNVCEKKKIVSVNVVAAQQHEQHMSKDTAVQKFRKHSLQR
jgi:Co/Zn/Cd efflux system component